MTATSRCSARHEAWRVLRRHWTSLTAALLLVALSRVAALVLPFAWPTIEDAIVALTTGPAWVTDPVNGDSFAQFVSSSSAAAISGYPDITVPAGHVGPFPIGITFIGGRWDEPTLISLAYSFEQATHVRVPPQFLASTP